MSFLGACLAAQPARADFPGLGAPDGVTVYVQSGGLVGPHDVIADRFLLGRATGLRGTGVELAYRMMSDDATRTRGYEFELGVGYEYMTGFASTRADMELHGAAQTLPSVSIYAIRLKPLLGCQPYACGRGGIVQLLDVRAYDAQEHQYAAEGQTFEAGAAIGLSHPTGWFIELAGEVREFRSLDWKPPQGITTVPAGWPHTLSLNNVSLAIGFEAYHTPRPKAPGGTTRTSKRE